ncbi:MAG: hypothetical protein M1335_01825, partial [Chloroflexi bacterium]|nr:hypothetical protein [Chloroflexota bacterium]
AGDGLEHEREDRYGRIPAKAKNLLDVMRIKLMAGESGLNAVRWSGGSIILSGKQFGDEWKAAARAVDSRVDVSTWLGKLTIHGVKVEVALSFLLKLFSGIMSEFLPQE